MLAASHLEDAKRPAHLRLELEVAKEDDVVEEEGEAADGLEDVAHPGRAPPESHASWGVGAAPESSLLSSVLEFLGQRPQRLPHGGDLRRESRRFVVVELTHASGDGFELAEFEVDAARIARVTRGNRGARPRCGAGEIRAG